MRQQVVYKTRVMKFDDFKKIGPQIMKKLEDLYEGLNLRSLNKQDFMTHFLILLKSCIDDGLSIVLTCEERIIGYAFTGDYWKLRSAMTKETLVFNRLLVLFQRDDLRIQEKKLPRGPGYCAETLFAGVERLMDEKAALNQLLEETNLLLQSSFFKYKLLFFRCVHRGVEIVPRDYFILMRSKEPIPRPKTPIKAPFFTVAELANPPTYRPRL